MKPDPVIAALIGRAAAEPWARLLLARIYDEGYGVKENPRLALRYYRWAAEAGNSQAPYFIGAAHYYGRGTRKNRRQAVAWFQEAKRRGNPAGLYMYAQCLMDGVGIKKDAKRGERLMRRAACLGDTDAMVYLGVLDKNRRLLNRASRWFSKAARAGNGLAEVWLEDLEKLRTAEPGRDS
jgi:TPR repeat protein